MDGCVICAKHRGEGSLGGELVAQVDGFWIYHAPPDEDGLAPLGYLFIETDRHAPFLADLTEEEAKALGQLRARLARGLREQTDVEFVFSMVVGLGVAHFHEHLVSRYAQAPKDLPWYRSHDAAPRADERTVAELIERLRSHISRAG